MLSQLIRRISRTSATLQPHLLPGVIHHPTLPRRTELAAPHIARSLDTTSSLRIDTDPKTSSRLAGEQEPDRTSPGSPSHASSPSATSELCHVKRGPISAKKGDERPLEGSAPQFGGYKGEAAERGESEVWPTESEEIVRADRAPINPLDELKHSRQEKGG